MIRNIKSGYSNLGGLPLTTPLGDATVPQTPSKKSLQIEGEQFKFNNE